MNKRILEIAEQAGVLADFGEDIKMGRYSIGGTNQSMEKFAELIVIECAKIASDSVIDHSGHSETNICPKYLACHIKDHFGVKE